MKLTVEDVIAKMNEALSDEDISFEDDPEGAKESYWLTQSRWIEQERQFKRGKLKESQLKSWEELAVQIHNEIMEEVRAEMNNK
jgi:hypothetical protein